MTLTIIRGDDEYIDLTLATASGTAADLTNVDLWFTVKESINDADLDAILLKRTPVQVVVLNPATSGLAYVVIDGADTKDLRARLLEKELYWDVQLLDGANKIQTVASGTLVVTRDVTRATS